MAAARASKTAKQERERTVAAIRTIWLSLDSHLDYSTARISAKDAGKFGGDRAFHAKTCAEYAQTILDLAKNL